MCGVGVHRISGSRGVVCWCVVGVWGWECVVCGVCVGVGWECVVCGGVEGEGIVCVCVCVCGGWGGGRE